MRALLADRLGLSTCGAARIMGGIAADRVAHSPP